MEEACEVGGELVHVGDGEYHPCQRNEEDDVDMLEHVCFVQQLSINVLFQHNKHEENQSPKHEVPACAVP